MAKRTNVQRAPSDRFNIQVLFKTAEQKKVIEQAAKRHGLATGTFVRVLAMRAARQVLASSELLKSVTIEIPSFQDE